MSEPCQKLLWKLNSIPFLNTFRNRCRYRTSKFRRTGFADTSRMRPSSSSPLPRGCSSWNTRSSKESAVLKDARQVPCDAMAAAASASPVPWMTIRGSATTGAATRIKSDMTHSLAAVYSSLLLLNRWRTRARNASTLEKGCI